MNTENKSFTEKEIKKALIEKYRPGTRTKQ